MIAVLALSWLVACDGGGGDTGPVPASVLINEILAMTDGASLDDAGEPSDWIELHNPGDSAMDLEGWSITDGWDEGAEPWPLPAGTVLDPGAFLVLWCDDQPEQGALHLGFTLYYDGEILDLLDPDGAIGAETRFGFMDPDVSWARVPDGSDLWRYLDPPTPGAANGT